MDEEKQIVPSNQIFTAKAGFIGGVLATLLALKAVRIAKRVLIQR